MQAEVGSKSLSPWAPEFRHIQFRGSIVRDRFSYVPASGDLCGRGNARLSEEEDAFLRFIFKEAGLELYRYRLGTIKRRIPAALRVLHASSFADARRVVQQKPALLP